MYFIDYRYRYICILNIHQSHDRDVDVDRDLVFLIHHVQVLIKYLVVLPNASTYDPRSKSKMSRVTRFLHAPKCSEVSKITPLLLLLPSPSHTIHMTSYCVCVKSIKNTKRSTPTHSQKKFHTSFYCTQHDIPLSLSFSKVLFISSSQGGRSGHRSVATHRRGSNER